MPQLDTSFRLVGGAGLVLRETKVILPQEKLGPIELVLFPANPPYSSSEHRQIKEL